MCQAHPVDLTEKSTPVNRAVLGSFGLAAKATRVPWHSRAETQALVPELQKHMRAVTNSKLAKLADYPEYLFDTWRDATTAQAAAFHAEAHANPPAQVLALCCGTGASSDYLRRAYPLAEIVGLDASPVHLAEAMRTGPADVLWKHDLAESCDLPDASQDLVTWTFTAHETPAPVARQIMAEAWRVLRPGGVFAFTDVPQLKGSWGLFGTLYTLLQHLGIEPHLPQRVSDAGFVDVRATHPGVPCTQVLGRKL